MRISKKIWGLSFGTAAVVAILATALIHEISTLSSDYLRLQQGPIHESYQVRMAQLTFKKEAQAWKNLLLRAKIPGSLEKYTKEFHAQQQALIRDVTSLRDHVQDPKAKQALNQFLADNEDFNRQSQKAYEYFVSHNFDYQGADKFVSGQNVVLTSVLDQAADALEARATQRSQAVATEAVHGKSFCIVFSLLAIAVLLTACYFVIQQIAGRLDQLKAVSGRIALADIDGLTADLTKTDRSITNDEISEVETALKELAFFLHEVVDGLKKLSAGDLSAQIAPKSEQDILSRSYQTTVAAIAALTEDVGKLAQAGVDGQLSLRVDAARHKGQYRRIVEGVNATLDAVIGPLNVTASYVDRIGKGDIPQPLTEEYRGDFRLLRDNMNACIGGLGGLVEADRVLQRIAVNDLTASVQGDYRGVFADVAQAVNQVRERVAHVTQIFNAIAAGEFKTELAEMTATGKHSEQDKLVPAILLTMQSIDALVEDTEMLANSAAEGKMGVRADTDRHQGHYRTVVEEINHLIEAFVDPLRVSAENAQMLSKSSEHLTTVSSSMADTAQETAMQASAVSAASEQISRNVASVAAASEEMQVSIREIAKSANDAAHVAGQAVNMATSTNETMQRLGQSSQEIGEVIKVIAAIAQQTNLLALNATIEAARAGESGKGFAVVANEVKELAKQTAKATEEIGGRVVAIQETSTGAVAAIAEIGGIIHKINDLSNTIASAVEEQTATTQEIGRSVTEASEGVDEITKNIGGVAEAAQHTTQGASDAHAASEEMNSMAARMHSAVAKFTF